MDITETRKKAFALANEKFSTEEKVHLNYSPVYLASTENVIDLMKLYKNYETVLSIGSTGAQGFEAALNGARKINLFDINELQRLYFEYMKTAITILDYETFLKHFTIKTYKVKSERILFKDFLSDELYDKLVKYLPKDVEAVYTPLYDYFNSVDLILSNLYRTDFTLLASILKKYISFYNEEAYYKLQKILRDERCQISYTTLPITEVINQYSGKYDLIMLSNVLQFYDKIDNLNTAQLVEDFIKNLSKLLTKDGVIEVSYLFEVATLAFKDKIGIPFDKSKINFIVKLILEAEKERSVNIPLYKSSDNYSYSFIKGVENDKGIEKSFLDNHENMILTYRNNKSNKIFKP